MLECVWCTFQFVDVHSRVWSGLGSGRKWEQGGSGQSLEQTYHHPGHHHQDPPHPL